VLRRPIESTQYASGDYQRVLTTHGIVGSMSRRGNCWDNAVAESFFATLKVELAHEAHWTTRAQAHAEIFEYLEGFYNGQRRHSALGYLSPLAFERQCATAAPHLLRSLVENARAVEAQGATIGRGAAISVSPKTTSHGRRDDSTATCSRRRVSCSTAP
jgi:Integrase core domain